MTTPTQTIPRGVLSCPISAVDMDARTIPILASTPNAPDETQPALTEWDLSRYEKNPVILWAHDQAGVHLPIGTCESLEVDPVLGLKAVVRLASEKANPLAEQVLHCVNEKVIRAVSVGYELVGPHKAKLTEISFVPVGLDEDAGTTDLTAAARADADELEAMLKALPKQEIPAAQACEPSDEEMRAAVSKAASVMSRYRARVAKALRDAEAAAAALKKPKEPHERADHFDVSRLDAVDLNRFAKTQAGGRVIPAKLTRVGVLRYMNPDGTYRRELRLPEEVFKADSMRTLEHAHVVDFKHHRSMVDTSTYKNTRLGSVTNVRQEGNYLVGDLRVDDADALDQIEHEERRDISCGYRCRLEKAPAGMTYDGQPVDFIQRDITYNHAALCPPNRGRAGPDVALRLDIGEDTHNGGGVVAHLDDMEEDIMIKVRLDGVEVVEHSPEHFALVGRVHARELEAINATLTKTRSDMADVSTKLLAETQRADKAEGSLDGLKAQVEQIRTDAADAATKAEEKLKDKEKAERAFVKARRKLERMTIRYFGGPDDEEEEEDEDEEKGKKSKKEFPPAKDDEKKGKRLFGEDQDPKEGQKGKRGFPQALKDELGVEDDKEEKKGKRARMDAMDERLDSMSDRELMLWCIKQDDPRFDSTDRSDDYVAARFDAACEARKASRGVNGIARSIEAAKRGGGNADRFDIDEAAAELDKARKDRDAKAAAAAR